MLDLWAAVAALNPDFNLNGAKDKSMEMQGRPAFNVIVMPQFEASRAYIPRMISLLGDRTTPPPEQPDYDEDGIPVVKKKRDMFRGEANQQTSKEKLARQLIQQIAQLEEAWSQQVIEDDKVVTLPDSGRRPRR